TPAAARRRRVPARSWRTTRPTARTDGGVRSGPAAHGLRLRVLSALFHSGKGAPMARRFAAMTFALAVTICSAAAFAGTTHRPISDFLETQGTFCAAPPVCTIFVPPVPNFVAFTDTVHDL